MYKKKEKKKERNRWLTLKRKKLGGFCYNEQNKEKKEWQEGQREKGDGKAIIYEPCYVMSSSIRAAAT